MKQDEKDSFAFFVSYKYFLKIMRLQMTECSLFYYFLFNIFAALWPKSCTIDYNFSETFAKNVLTTLYM
jgi:hypothetical protein